MNTLLLPSAVDSIDRMSFVEDFFEKHREGLLYIFYGGLTMLVSWGTYALFVLIGIDFNIANWLSVACALIFAFVVNKWMVFRSRSLGAREIAKELFWFAFFRGLTIMFRLVGFPILITLGITQSLFGVYGFVALIIVTMVEIVANYLASKYIVFRKKKENASE